MLRLLAEQESPFCDVYYHYYYYCYNYYFTRAGLTNGLNYYEQGQVLGKVAGL